MTVTFNPSAPRSAGTPAQDAQNSGTTERIEWNGFSLGKIPTDSYAIRNELRRSYAGVDQEMLRQMAEKDQKQRDLRKQEDTNKPRPREDGSANNRRDFALVEQPLAPPVEETSRASPGATAAGKKAGKGDPEDLFEQAIDLSNSFNEAGATFKV